MASPRKLEGTHRSLGRLVCDRCGCKTSADQTGRSVMRAHLAAKHPADDATEPAPAGSWPMWAHHHHGEYQHIGEKWWVEIHGLPDPVHPVTVTEVPADAADGTHWGWIHTDGSRAAGTGIPDMIWAFRGAFDAQFPYGVKAEEDAGHGRAVRLRITRRDDD